MAEMDRFPIPKIPDRVVTYDIPAPNISNPHSLPHYMHSVVISRQVIYLHRSTPERDLYALRRKNAQNKSEFLQALSLDLHRSAFQLLLATIGQSFCYANGNKIYFMVVSLMLILISQVGFQFFDILNLKKQTMNRKTRSAIKFAAIRAIKNTLLFVCCLVTIVQLKTDSKVDTWMLAVEIILVLYFVLIIYFIINTGEMVQYMRTMLFNIMVFIQSFFAQREVAKNGVKTNDQGEHFLQSLWMFPLIAAVYGLILVYFFIKGPLGFLLKSKTTDMERKKGKRLINTRVLAPASSLCLTTSVYLLVFHLPVRPVPFFVFALLVASSLLFVTGGFYYSRTMKLVDDIYKKEIEEISKIEDAHEVKEEAMEVPYFMTRVSGGSLFRPSDQFDLLKLSIYMQQEAQFKSKESLKKEQDSKLVKIMSMKSDPSGFVGERSSFKYKMQNMEIQRVPNSFKMKNRFAEKHTGYMIILQENVKSMNNFSRHHSDESLRTDQAQVSQIHQSKGEEVCFICCENSSNAIALPCAHGGICLRCMFDLWIKGKACYMCKAVKFYQASQ